jgi:hypothetical protein
LPDVLFGDDDSADDDGFDVDAALLGGPQIAEELGAKAPLFTPVGFEFSSNLLITDNWASIPLAEEISAADIDEWIAGDWMTGKNWIVERNCKRELESWFTIDKERLYWLSSRWVGGDVGFDGGSSVVARFRRFFVGHELSPEFVEGCECAGDFAVGGCAIGP